MLAGKKTLIKIKISKGLMAELNFYNQRVWVRFQRKKNDNPLVKIWET